MTVVAPRPAHLRVADLGVGAGLRVPHYAYLQEHGPDVGFFEIITENFLGAGGKPLYFLDWFRERYPLVLHGVSLSIGGPEEPRLDYLAEVKRLVKRVRPPWISDHLCWCGAGNAHLHELLPLPYTEEAIERVARRARFIQDYLELPFALENTSSYLSYEADQMNEWEFVREIAERADCGLLFDVNNVYVSSQNHDYDPLEFVRSVPRERILQIHLAGHTRREKYLLDTHDGPVSDPVLDLYKETIRLAGPISTLIEWDEDVPEFPRLLEEIRRIERARSDALSFTEQPEAGDTALHAAPRRGAPDSPRVSKAPGAALTDTQAWVTELLQGRRDLTKRRELEAEARSLISESVTLAPLERLEIYREQYWFRHTRSLLEDFPGLSGLAGQSLWERVIEDYLAHFPPKTHQLRDLGRDLPEHLAHMLALGERELSVSAELLVEMARLDWAHVECFDAPAADPDWTIQELPPEQWENARVLLRPALRVLELDPRLLEWRRSLRRGEHIAPSSTQLSPRAHFVISRDEQLEIQEHFVERGESLLLESFSRRERFGDTCPRVFEQLAAEDPAFTEGEFESKLSAWFARWKRLGWLVGLEANH